MKLTKFEILLADDRELFQPGDSVHGTVVLESSQVIQFKGIRIRYKGRAEVTAFIGDYETQKETYFTGYELLVGKMPSDETKELVTLQPGTYEYRFHFHLPHGIPSSFVVQGDNHAKVSYTVDAIIHRPGMFNYFTRRSLGVRSQLDVRQVPGHNEEVRVEGGSPVSCLCFQKGEIAIRAHVLRKAYVAGEDIQVFAEILNNSTGRAKRSVATLMQTVWMSVSTFHTGKTRRIYSCSRGPIPPGGSDEWTGESLSIPNNLPPSGLEGCSMIDVQYSVELAVTPGGLSCSNISVLMPIVIGTPVETKHVGPEVGELQKSLQQPVASPVVARPLTRPAPRPQDSVEFRQYGTYI